MAWTYTQASHNSGWSDKTTRIVWMNHWSVTEQSPDAAHPGYIKLRVSVTTESYTVSPTEYVSPVNDTISYGGTFITEKTTRVATISVGYGDGYPRSLSNKGYVLIRGKRAPILGRICMDQLMVDVSDIPGAKEGDLVTLIGTDGEETITCEALGDLSGRFNYELACDIGKRVPRIYRQDEKN